MRVYEIVSGKIDAFRSPTMWNAFHVFPHFHENARYSLVFIFYANTSRFTLGAR